MPGKRQPPKKAPAQKPEATVNPIANEINQVGQMRKNLVNEIKELKKQVLLVQLQSMKVMQQSVHSVFKTQTNKTTEQITQQSADLQNQFEEEADAMKTLEADNNKKVSDEMNSSNKQVEKFNDIVLNAMQSAQQSVDSAMEAAQKIMGDAENILKGS